MKVEEELLSFLHEKIRESDYKSRNIGIIVYHYGFGDSVWPTLEETAAKFGLHNRKRVLQLLKSNFRDFAEPKSFPSVQECASILMGSLYISSSDYAAKLANQGLMNEDCNIQGLLTLMHDLDLALEYEAYTPELSKVTRSLIEQCEETYLLTEVSVKKLQKDLKMVRTLPGRLGIAKLEYLSQKIDGWSEKKSLFKSIIKNSSRSWSKEEADSFWYIFENRDNTLINYSEKVFSQIESCDASHLATVYRNALNCRRNQYEYPPGKIIENYLRNSSSFDIDGNALKCRFSEKTTTLNDIEKDIISYLQGKDYVCFPEFKRHLEALGYSKAHIVKATTTSPLVYVDKSRGRNHHRYSLVSALPKDQELNIDKRYACYRKRLLRLRDVGTDEPVKSKRRREQNILQEWLFKEKSEECCAICGNLYSIGALVTAYKKKRTKCNDTERLDPFIVMPICKFGCDYLYENEFIFIENGCIKVNPNNKTGTHEYKAASLLKGRKVDDIWLKGGDDYFSKPNI